jgi:dephospho-CoA kinase
VFEPRVISLLTPNKSSIVVGLTGGIASGKSTVSRHLKERSVPVVDADVLARQVVAPGTSGLRAIVGHFGADILSPDGTLDRKMLGDIIFKDAKKRKILNGIVHPAVRRAMLREVVRCWWGGESICVLDVPLLVEAGLWRWVGDVVVIYWWVLLVFNLNERVPKHNIDTDLLHFNGQLSRIANAQAHNTRQLDTNDSTGPPLCADAPYRQGSVCQ